MTNKTEIIETTIQETSPASMMMTAIAQGLDLSKVEKAMELQAIWEKRQAEKAYNKAIAEFKANPPEIIKESTVNYDSSKGKVNYKYASLANVIEKVTPELSKYGLSMSWRTSQNGKINVTCRISHELGHYEETSLCADADSSGSKNAIQAVGSTITYMQRYTALALLGLACSDQDDDGISSGPRINEAPPQPQSQQQTPQPSLKESIRTMAKKKFNTQDDFKAWRVENGLYENLETVTDLQLSQMWAVLRERKDI